MRRRILLVISTLMALFAIAFVVYALGNPQASFPWSNAITYTIYFVYLVAMVLVMALSRLEKMKLDEKEESGDIAIWISQYIKNLIADKE